MPDCKTVSRIEECLGKIPRRRMIFLSDVLWVLILGVVAWVLIQKNNCILPTVPDLKIVWSTVTTYCVLWTKYKLLFNCMWFGALGGVAVSLKGVYDHGASADPWKDDYNLWHIGRPVSGAIAGLIAGLLLYVIVPTDKLSHVVLYGVAFIFGMQDRAFFDFLSSFAARFLPPRNQSAPTLQVTAIAQPQGKAGDAVKITGQSIDRNAIARIGGVKIGTPVIAPDGTSISGTVPTLTVEKDKKVDVDVINPGGRSIVLLEGFKYLG
jgi:hypothetical protein